MAGKSTRTLFEELGLLDVVPPPNPLAKLGIKDLAPELLDLDPSGESLRIAAKGLSRTLAGIYHPDSSNTPDTERFQEIQDARAQLDEADTTALRKWAKQETSSDEKLADRFKTEKKQTAARASGLLEQFVEDADNPLFFSNFRESNGLLLLIDDKLSLLEPTANGKSQITPSTSFKHISPDIEKNYAWLVKSQEQEVLDSFEEFENLEGSAREHGLPPIKMMFVNKYGQAFIYDESYNPLGEVGYKLTQYIEAASKVANKRLRSNTASVLSPWARTNDVRLINLDRKDDGSLRGMRIIYFPEQSHEYESKRRKKAAVPTLPTNFTAAGSIKGDLLFKDLRGRARPQTNSQLLSTQEPLHLPFSVNPFSYEDLIGTDSAFTPLLNNGNRLVVRDVGTGQLSVGTPKVVGLLR